MRNVSYNALTALPSFAHVLQCTQFNGTDTPLEQLKVYIGGVWHDVAKVVAESGESPVVRVVQSTQPVAGQG